MTDLEDSQVVTYSVVFLICLAVSAFFASAEIAYMHLQHIRVKHLQEPGRHGADRVARIKEHPEKFLSVVLTSISFTETIVVALGGFLVVHVLRDVLSEQVAALIGIVLMAISLDRLTQALGQSSRHRGTRHWYEKGPAFLIVKQWRKRNRPEKTEQNLSLVTTN